MGGATAHRRSAGPRAEPAHRRRCRRNRAPAGRGTRGRRAGLAGCECDRRGRGPGEARGRHKPGPAATAMQQHRSGRNACRRDRARRGRRGARRQLSKYLFDEKTGVFSVITMSRPQVKVARFAAGSPLAEGYQGVLHDVPDGTFMGGGSAPGDGMRLRFRVPRDEITRFATALGGAAQVVGDGLADQKEGGGGGARVRGRPAVGLDFPGGGRRLRRVDSAFGNTRGGGCGVA